MGSISKRVTSMAVSATLAMSKKSRDLKAQGIEVIDLSVGEPDFNTPDFIKRAGIKAIEDDFSHYPPVAGFLDLQQAVCTKLKRDNGLDYSPNQIIVSNGAKHSLMNIFMAMVDPGEEVIIPVPYWVSYPEMVKFVDGIPVFIPTTGEQNFKITPEQLEAAITPKTKLLLFNSPSNPSGMVYSRDELRALANVLERYPEIYIVSDEIYELIVFDDTKFESFAQFPSLRERMILVNGVSKGFAMTGWRIGYIAAPVEIAAAYNKVQGQMTSAASSIAQKAAVTALLRAPSESSDLHDMVTTFKHRRDILLEMLEEIKGFKTLKPTGAFYVFPDISALLGKRYGQHIIKSGDDLANYLIEVAHVAIVGGDSFGSPNHIRISYATNTDKLIAAINQIKAAVALLS
ncbi:MAG: pyridoxal phosphate-dependent aminotransferase [Bacteroidales bacterium]|jgi:aspartate aminotransferase|nr:pyridoxal phosphate-dependent aminotransferase [Bacteroidales bacterium]